MKLDFDPAKHEYRIDGKPVPSVTQVIASLYDFSAIPRWVVERKGAIGTAVHAACEWYDEGCLDRESVDPVIEPYFEAWRRFRLESEIDLVEVEKRLACPVLRYAGTVDRIVDRGGRRWIVDLKTAAAVDPAVGVQLAGYLRLARSSGLVGAEDDVGRAAVQLRNDGTYRWLPFESPDDDRTFISLLNVFHWKGKHHV